MGISYEIARFHTPICGVYEYRIDRITKEPGKAIKTEEYQLCKTIEEALEAKLKLERKM